MDIFSPADALSWHDPAALLVLVGLLLLWRGLLGWPTSTRALLRRGDGFLGRLEGFRLAVVGLVLIGLGAAWLFQAPLLLFLALGIGFVEILESSVVIAAWRRRGTGLSDAADHPAQPNRVVGT